MANEPQPQNQDPLSDPALTPQDECPHDILIHLHGTVFRCKWCKKTFSDYDDE